MKTTIKRSELSEKNKEIFDKIKKAFEVDKVKAQKFLDAFEKNLAKETKPAPKKSTPKKKVVAKKATPKKSTPKKSAPKGKKQRVNYHAELRKIMAEFGINRKDALRIYKSKKKNSKGEKESISALIARFKKEFGAIKPHSSRDLKKDSEIKAKTSVKRKSPTYGKKGGAKKPFYYEYRMNRRDNSSSPAYLEKGGLLWNDIYDKYPSSKYYMSRTQLQDSSPVRLKILEKTGKKTSSGRDIYKDNPIKTYIQKDGLYFEEFAKGGYVIFADIKGEGTADVEFFDSKEEAEKRKKEYEGGKIKEVDTALGMIPVKEIKSFYIEKEKFAKGGKVSSDDIGETVKIISQDNVVGDLIGIDGNTAYVDFSDYNRPESGEKRDYFDISEIKVVKYDWDKDEYYAKGGKVNNGYFVSWIEDGQTNVEKFESKELAEAKEFFNQIKTEKFSYEKPKVVLTSADNDKVIMGKEFDKGGEIEFAKGGKVGFDAHKNTPITFILKDEKGKEVFKTKSLNRASDESSRRGEKISILAIDSKGNTKKLDKGGEIEFEHGGEMHEIDCGCMDCVEVSIEDLVFVEPENKEMFLTGGEIIGTLGGAFVGYKVAKSVE